MQGLKKNKNCLVISYGPVPTSKYQTVEGGGMRAWGLAKGLQQNQIDVTVAINESFPQREGIIEGINLINWKLDNDFIDLINSFDSVLISYCMGDPSVFVTENIKDEIQLILDVYVPIYVEVSARDSTDMANEYPAYQSDIAKHNKVLQRGDYFICANEVQKIFYTGVLGGLGVINPLSYRQDRIKIVPFGIHDTPAKSHINPYEKLGIKKTDKVILWFGGLYPWFRVEELLNSIKILSEKDSSYKFVIVGGKNPFNNNPDLLRQYEFAQSFSKKNALLGESLYFVDWVNYEDRINWYKNADFVISINQPGDENIFAWRTRVMDFIWGEVVSITNGGDPLGDELLEKKAALPLAKLNSATIISTIESIYKEKGVIATTKKSLIKVKAKYYWNNITQELSLIIKESDLPFKKERDFVLVNKISSTQDESIKGQSATSSKINKVIRNPKIIFNYARKKGIRRSAKLGLGIVKNQIRKRVDLEQSFVFISHPIDNTGAPLVLLQIIDEVIEKYGAKRVRLIAPYIEEEILINLRRKGIKVEKAALMSYSLTAAQLSLKANDFVFINTVAIYDNYLQVALNMLAHNRIPELHWFIHEDEAQLHVVKPMLEKGSINKSIRKLLSSGKLNIYVPSKRVKIFYDNLFDTKSVSNVPLRVDVPEKYKVRKTPESYSSLSFFISGTPSDGRKGQLIAIAAFQQFILKYQDINPEQYRNFDLHLVSIGEDYISQQIKSIGKSVLGKKLHTYPALPRNEALKIAFSCNAVICCSLNETFALYVAEGMLMGAVVLRNDSAGVDEQLKDGLNGYAITDDIDQFAKVIEKLLNKNTKNKDLQNMGEISKDMMKTYASNKYLENIIKSE